MKKHLLLFLIALVLWGAESAQAQTEVSAQTNTLQPSLLKDGYAMHQGSMIQIKNGEFTPLTKEATLPNGTKVLRDGTVIFPRNRREKIKEGYFLNTEGKIVMLDYDMFRYDVIQNYAKKTVGNTQTELIVSNDGVAHLANSTEAQMLNRKIAIVSERNALIKQKAELLNKAKTVKEQQNSPAIKAVDAQLQLLDQEQLQIEQALHKQ